MRLNSVFLGCGSAQRLASTAPSWAEFSRTVRELVRKKSDPRAAGQDAPLPHIIKIDKVSERRAHDHAESHRTIN